MERPMTAMPIRIPTGAGRIAVVHNGIIENHGELRAALASRGCRVHQRDGHRGRRAPGRPDVAARHLVHSGTPFGPVRNELAGAFTLVVLDKDPARSSSSELRRNSPLVLGVGQGEMFLGSDVAAFIEFTREAVELGQDQVVRDLARSLRDYVVRWAIRRWHAFSRRLDLAAAEKGGFDYFMLKEIQEQPRAVADTLRGHLVGGQIVLMTSNASTVKTFVTSTRSSWSRAALPTTPVSSLKHAIEHWTRIPVEVEMASEFRYRDPVLDRQTLVAAISQSGETADTLEAVRHARSQRAKVLSICNTNGAQIPESPTPCSTRTPGRRSGWRQPRPLPRRSLR